MDNELIIPLILFSWLLLHNLVSLIKHHKYYKNFQNIPNLHLPLEGMFIKIKGKVTTQNTLRTPLSKRPCSFYQLRATGEYSVKRKSPSNGYETIRKQLSVEQATDKILIDKKNQIFIEIEKEKAVILKIKEKLAEHKKALSTYPSHPKVTNYLYKESYLMEGDEVVVFGRLLKKDYGYVITHTHSNKLPFMIYLNDTSKLVSNYKNKIRINLFFIPLALVGIYMLM